MGEVLENRIWFKEDRGVAANFTRLVERLDPLKQDTTWGSAAIRSATSFSGLARLTNPSGVDEILTAAAAYDEPLEISVTGSLACWRIGRNAQPEMGSVVMTVSCWDHEGNTVRPDRRFEGDGDVHLDRPGDFVFRDSLHDEQVTAAIADNCQTLMSVVRAMVGTTDDVAVTKTLFEGYFRHPMNSHISYLADDSVILEDLALLGELWDHGAPTYREPPLKDQVRNDRRAVRDERGLIDQALFDQLYHYAKNHEDVSLESLAHLDWELVEHEVVAGGGRILMNPPYVLNANLMSFYIDVLDNESALYGGPVLPRSMDGR